MAEKNLILIGGGGHCEACIDVVEASGEFQIHGIVDIEDKLRQKVSGYEIIASDKDLPSLIKRYKYFLITIGYIKEPDKRIEKFKLLKRFGTEFPVIISSLAYVSKRSNIEEGTIIMHRANVNCSVNIGANCIVNTCALIEHNVKIGSHCHISTGSIINGECTIGDSVFLGSNSVVVNNTNIADNVIIGAGSVVVKSINESGVYAGVPARRIDRYD